MLTVRVLGASFLAGGSVFGCDGVGGWKSARTVAIVSPTQPPPCREGEEAASQPDDVTASPKSLPPPNSFSFSLLPAGRGAGGAFIPTFSPCSKRYCFPLPCRWIATVTGIPRNLAFSIVPSPPPSGSTFPSG